MNLYDDHAKPAAFSLESCPCRRAKPNAINDGELDKLAAIYSILADKTRLRLLHCLSSAGEMCVCDLTEATGFSQPLISSRLRLLRDARLVKRRQEGKRVFYSLDDDHVKSLFACALEHIRHQD